VKHGRLFSPEPGQWLVVGRNQADNQALAGLAREGDTLFSLDDAPGPTVLAPGPEPPAPRLRDLGRSLAAAYGARARALDPSPREGGGVGDLVFRETEVRGISVEVPVRVETLGQPPVREPAAVTSPTRWKAWLLT
jgi:hypothetical protein